MEAYAAWLGSKARALRLPPPVGAFAGVGAEAVARRATAAVDVVKVTGRRALVAEAAKPVPVGRARVIVAEGIEPGVTATEVLAETAQVTPNAWLGGAVRGAREWGPPFDADAEARSVELVLAGVGGGCDTTTSCTQLGASCTFMSSLALVDKAGPALAALGVAFPQEVLDYVATLTACAGDEARLAACPPPPKVLRDAWNAPTSAGVVDRCVRAGDARRALEGVRAGGVAKTVRAVVARLAELTYQSVRPDVELWPRGPASVVDGHPDPELRVGGTAVPARVIADGAGRATDEQRERAVAALVKACPVQGHWDVGVVNADMTIGAEALHALMKTSNAREIPMPGWPTFAISHTDPDDIAARWDEELVDRLRMVTLMGRGDRVAVGGLVTIRAEGWSHNVAWTVCPDGKVQLWDPHGEGYAAGGDPEMFRRRPDHRVTSVFVLEVGPGAPFADAAGKAEPPATLVGDAGALQLGPPDRLYERARAFLAEANVAAIAVNDDVARLFGIDAFRDLVALQARAAGLDAKGLVETLRGVAKANPTMAGRLRLTVAPAVAGTVTVTVNTPNQRWVLRGKGSTLDDMAVTEMKEKGGRASAARAFAHVLVAAGNPRRPPVRCGPDAISRLEAEFERLGAGEAEFLNDKGR